MSQLRIDTLKKRYKSRVVVKDVSLEVSSGEIVGLLGPNGAGKTTCFYMIVGLVAVDGGRIFVDGRDISRMPMHRRARLGLSYLPQEASVFRKLTVEENIRAVLELQGLPEAEILERLQQLLGDLNIAHLHKATALSLSGGERRRVEIARALATRPTLYSSGRAFRRRRSDRRARHPAHHPLPQGALDRRPHHGPQRARNPGHLRPRLHHQRRLGACIR